MDCYALREIGYARLIVFEDRRACYFERLLCTRERPCIFNSADFTWRWSKQRNRAAVKEQLSALHGFHRATGRKWWAWHGLGENQLHFNGEREWWPSASDPHAVMFTLPGPDEKLSFDRLADLLEAL